MVDLTKYSDDELQAMLKQTQAAPAEEGPSILADVRDSAAAGLAQGSIGLLGTPGALTDLAGRGISKVGEWTDSQTLQNVGQGIQQSRVATKWSPEAWQQTADPLLQALHIDPNYQPQTAVGRYARTGAAFLPATAASMIAGPEAMGAALARGVGGAVGSETLGHAVEDYAGVTGPDSWESGAARMVGALGGGMVGPRFVTPFPATSPARTALANQVEGSIGPFGGRVEAAQATGSPTLRLLQGPAKSQDQAVTSSLFDRAGIKYDPNSTSKLSDDLAHEEGVWKQNADAIARNTDVIPDRQLWYNFSGHNQLTNPNPNSIEALANKAFAHLPAERQEFNDAATHLRSIVSRQGTSGNQPVINGPEYVEFVKKFGNSSNQYVKDLVHEVQGAADRSSPLWQASNEKYANIQGLKAGAEAYKGPDRLVDPGAVVSGMRKNTPMRDAADAADKILTPVKKAEPSGIASLATTAAGAGLGHLVGGPETGVIGLLLAQQGLQGGNRAMQAAFNNRYINNYLKNQKLLPQQLGGGPWGSYRPGLGGVLDPKTAAALLSQPGAVLQSQLRTPQQ